jgi:hypothetical protein
VGHSAEAGSLLWTTVLKLAPCCGPPCFPFFELLWGGAGSLLWAKVQKLAPCFGPLCIRWFPAVDLSAKTGSLLWTSAEAGRVVGHSTVFGSLLWTKVFEDGSLLCATVLKLFFCTGHIVEAGSLLCSPVLKLFPALGQSGEASSLLCGHRAVAGYLLWATEPMVVFYWGPQC